MKVWNNIPKSQRYAFIFILFFLLLLSSIDFYLKRSGTETEDKLSVIKYLHLKKRPGKTYKKTAKKITSLLLFDFDPNTVSEEKLMKLGLEDYQITNLINYRKAGGVFKKKEDLKKIYTIKGEDFNRLSPYITLKTAKAKTHKRELQIKKKVVFELDINTAAYKEFITAFGIDYKIAKRIVNYRDALGGFYSKKQLEEVYGFDKPDSLLKKLIIDKTKIRKININLCTLTDLEKHPYVQNYEAKAIMIYREYKGRIESIDEIKENNLLIDSTLYKISSYISF